MDSLIGSGVVYCVGMAVFTVIMSNTFVVCPIMTAPSGYPVLLQHFHGNATAVFAIGMLVCFCGTLCTAMAANVNLVPVALLDMNNRYGVMHAQLRLSRSSPATSSCSTSSRLECAECLPPLPSY